MLTDKEDRVNYVYLLILTLPKDILISVIKNTPMDDQMSNKVIQDYIVYAMKPYPPPGTYINIAARGKASQQATLGKFMAPIAPQQEKNPGRWMTGKQAHVMICTVKKFIQQTQATDDIAEIIDNVFCWRNANDQKITKQPHGRRFAQNTSQVSNLQSWSKDLKSYCDRLDSADLTTPMYQCPIKVGWSLNMLGRLEDHKENYATDALSGKYCPMYHQTLHEERLQHHRFHQN